MSTIATPPTVASIFQSTLGPIQERLPAWLQPIAQRLCSHLSPWVSEISLDDTARAFAPMLRTLKTAVESYLGVVDSVQTVGVSLPQSTSPQYRDFLQAAASSVSLYLFEPRFSGVPAGVYAAKAYGMTGDCYESGYCDDERLLLTIDYSRAALTAVLMHDEAGLCRTLRTFHSESLGEIALDRACSSPDLADFDCIAALRAALTNITTLPVSEDEDAKGITYIQNIVLHGESASNPRLNVVLRDVLRKQFDEDDVVKSMISSGQASSNLSPLYAAARGIAQFGWWVTNEPPPDGCNCNDYTRRRMC